jgi:hypothetical protein
VPYCNACGSETPEGARFCQNCGAEIGTPPPVTDTLAANQPTSPAPPTAYSQTPPAASGAPSIVPPYYPYPPAYPNVPGQPYLSRTNGKAVAGMYLGIASVFPGALFNWIGIVIGITGLIFSLIALNEIRLSVASPYVPPQSGRNQARTGLILSIVGIILSTLFLIYLLNNLDKYGIKLTR